MTTILNFVKQLDKLLHILMCFGLTLALALVLPPQYAVVIVLLLGAAKEIYDYRYPLTHTADVMDFVADVVGIAAASACVLLAPVLLAYLGGL